MKIIDIELEEAKSKDECLEFYEVTYDVPLRYIYRAEDESYVEYAKYKFIKQYKPSVAQLFKKRTGWNMQIIHGR